MREKREKRENRVVGQTRQMDRGLFRRPLEFHPVRRSALIGATVALLSQFYFNVISSDFRISIAVVLLPVLLMTMGAQIHSLSVCGFTALIVFLFRVLVAVGSHGYTGSRICQQLPGALFYVCYGILFRLQIPNKRITTLPRVVTAVFFCDLLANIAELLLRALLLGTAVNAERALFVLFPIALLRAGLVLLALVMDRQYRELQVRHEQESRYQRLFLMITGLKSELYLMRKNSEEIERVMGNAYHLSEELRAKALPEEMQRRALDIARDVHEIKKDYLRIIRGLEETAENEYDEDHIRFRELMEILDATSNGVIREKRLDIRLIYDCRDDFLTREHYALMTVLKNLVGNAIEAIEGDRRRGTITVSERQADGCYLFAVSDNGPGILPRKLDKIFRLGYSTKFDERTGNIYRGVGLAGVKNMVEEHFGGTITVRSEPGNTCFSVKIPAEAIAYTEEERAVHGERT